MIHQSVLLNEVQKHFDLKNRNTIIDATLGLGGHAKAFFMNSEFRGSIIGIDQDQAHLLEAGKNLIEFSNRFRGVHMNFADLRSLVSREEIKFDGILFDLGVASPHFDIAERGFSYQAEGPLDMRMDQERALTAEVIVNTYDEEALTSIFYEYGEEPLARRIAKMIISARAIRPLKRTTQLRDLIKEVYVSAGFFNSRKNPATKAFQALRIAVNDELMVLEQALKDSIDLIEPSGKILVISYHSLEDRTVKQIFKAAENPCICPPKLPVCACGRKPVIRILTKKAIVPSEKEINENPRARSAKLRVAERHSANQLIS